MLKRLAGVIMIISGVIGVTLSVAGMILIQRIPEHPPARLEEQLTLLDDTLAALADGMDTASQGLDTAADGLETLQTTTVSLTRVISNTNPTLTTADNLITKEIPDRVDAIQGVLPTLERAAFAVDSALLQVSEFEALLVNLGFLSSPRITYDPEMFLSEGVARLEGSLVGLSDRLRSVEPNFNLAEQQLGDMEDVVNSVGDLSETVGEEIVRLQERVQEFDALLVRLDGAPGDLRDDVTTLIKTAKPATTALLAWLGLSQLVPLYVGLMALRSRTTT
jgi:archaellum component FlaC